MEKQTLDTLTAFSAVLSAIAVFVTIYVTWRVAQTQKLLTQRQLLIPLWQYMSKIDDIDPANPKPREVTEAVNTLELVALCCEGGMVDEAVVKRTFAAPFIEVYETVNRLPEMPSLRKDGAALLRDNPSAMSFYRTLKEELEARGKLKKVR